MALKESKKLEQANSYELVVTVDGETFEKALNTVYKKEVKKINIPGFRKGKAPRHIIEKMYGKEVFYDDAMQDCYPEALYNAAEEAGVKIVAVESIEVTEVENGFTFKANIVVEPDMEINNYLGFEVTKKSTEVTDELIDEEIEKVRDRNSRMVTVEDRPVANGDIAVIDFEGFVDGVAFDGGKAENYNLTIGSGNFIPGFEEQIIGHSTDEEFSINVKFPEEYQAEELAGKDAEFKIKLHEIKAKEYAELDDEFAKDVSDFDTLDEFKADIRAKLEESAKNAADAKLDADITDAVIEKLEGEIPDAMINNRVDDLVRDWEYRNRYQGITVADYLKFTNTTIEQFKENFKEPAAKQVKLRLALEKIAQIENVAVTDEDVEKEYAEMAENYKMELDKVKALVAEEALRKDLEVEKAFDIVRESADVTEVTE